VVTNFSALRQKYGDRVRDIDAALERLVAADQARGLRTQVLGLDDPNGMAALGAPVVADARDPRQVKVAVDALFATAAPDYLMLLGATDVVPYQPLRNPLFGPDGDTDEYALGDLPYACDAPYSSDPADFIGPTRVVGRLPDVTGATDPTELLGLLEAAGRWQSRPLDDYLTCLGVSAAVWKASTHLSLQQLFGTAGDLQLSPGGGPRWPDELLGRRIHFINCHGAEADPCFYGQDGADFPVAHDGALLSGRILDGTIAAVECCYGAELYDPADAGGKQGMANVYLANGAYGFFGSSTTAYGPAEGNGAADLICQYFLRHVLAGASLGRAALEARQEFVREVTVVDPADLKTLAQFTLLGDPSVHPVRVPSEDFPSPRGAPSAAPEDAATAALTPGRDLRRRNLVQNGLALLESTTVARDLAPVDDPASVLARLREWTGEPLHGDALRSYQIERPAIARGFGASPPGRLHVVVSRQPDAPHPGPSVVAVIAREEDGELISYRTLYSR
jgi:hypothetical protein